MSCETIEETINSALYVTTQWPATKQITMKFKLVKTFGDSLIKLFQGVDTTSKTPEVNVEAFEGVISSVFDKVSPEDLTNLIKEILTDQATKRDGERITDKNFDKIYNDAGLGEMYKACLFVIKANYADFFKGQKAEVLLATLQEKS